MLPPDTLDEIEGYWAAHLGCPPGALFEANVVVLPHSAFKGYQGLFIVRRGESCIISAPAELINLVHTLVHQRPVEEVFGSGLWRQQLPDVLDQVVGPAFIAYADASTLRPAELPGTLAIGPEENHNLLDLRAIVGNADWERGGILPSHPLIVGHWEGGKLTSAGSYEVWGDRIAQIGAATAPEFRGRGHAKAVVTVLAQHAIEEGLIPQIRSLVANHPAASLARALGFETYADSLAVGLNVPRIMQLVEEEQDREEEPVDEEGED